MEWFLGEDIGSDVCRVGALGPWSRADSVSLNVMLLCKPLAELYGFLLVSAILILHKFAAAFTRSLRNFFTKNRDTSRTAVVFQGL